MKHRNIAGLLSSVTGIILLSKLLGFGKQMVVAGIFGATVETDLISLSQSFIGNIQYVLVQTLLTSLVTMYIHLEAEQGALSAHRFAGDVIRAFTLIAVAVMALVELTAPWIARIIAPSYPAGQSASLACYLRLYAPALVLFVWMAVFQATLTAKKRFLPGETVSSFQSVLLVASVLAFRNLMGAAALTLGFFVYNIWNTVYLGALSRKHWKLEARGNPFCSPEVRRLLRMIAPLLLGYSLVYVNQQVDKILVSGLTSGSVTALGYGAVLSNLISTFIVSFGNILFSYVTADIAAGRNRAAAVKADRAAVLLVAVFLPISILTILCARDIVMAIFGRGAFNAAAVETAGLALAGYGFSFVPLVLREVYSRIQYGYRDTRQPMVNASIGIVCNIVLSVALCPRYGVLGVTFASSVSVSVCGVLNLVSARRHNEFLSPGALLRPLPLLVVGGVACGVTAVLCIVRLTTLSPLVRFAAVTACAGAAYLLVISPLLWRLIKELRKS